MFVLDANILIYAFRQDSPYHAPCYDWLTTALSRGEDVTAPGVVELALVRVTTLASLGAAAATPQDVFTFLQALRQTSYRRLEPGDAHEAHFQRLCGELGLRGNDVNDAYLAALALERHAVLVSADKGFQRFRGVSWLNPLTASAST
jgi:toxin-antitoxin system PIN domain toxin